MDPEETFAAIVRVLRAAEERDDHPRRVALSPARYRALAAWRPDPGAVLFRDAVAPPTLRLMGVPVVGRDDVDDDDIVVST